MRSSMKRGLGAGAAFATVGALLLVPQAATAATEGETTDIQILGINDFHGRLEADSYGGLAGAAGLVGAVRQFESENPNTLFVSAGDNIGASTFTSFIQQDEPTMEALAVGGLDVSAVGNHEFDRGFADLTDRVLPRFGGAEFGLGANVYEKGTETPALDEYTVTTVDGVRVAFIGVVTPDTANMVTPTGIANLDFGDQLQAANRVATDEALQLVADVFWFSIEFGVVWEGPELKAYGAGILSSYGEIEEFRSMEIEPLDLTRMGSIDYDITKYQPVLFAAASLAEIEDVIGGFFAEVDDDTPSRLGVRRQPAGVSP